MEGPRDELIDLRVIAEAWGVTPALVAWSMVESSLARARAESPQLGTAGLAIAAALDVLRLPEVSADPEPTGGSEPDW